MKNNGFAKRNGKGYTAWRNLLTMTKVFWFVIVLTGCGGGSGGGESTSAGSVSVISITPLSNNEQVAVDAPISAVFDADIDPTTLNSSTVKISGPYGEIPGTVTYNSVLRSVVFDPTASLMPLTDYTATVTGVKDTAGRALAGSFSWTFRTSLRDFTVTGEGSLKERAAQKGLIFGAATKTSANRDAGFAAAFAEEIGMLTTEWELKWNALRPTPDNFDFAASDSLLNFAKSHNMLFHGHTLVWHQALPSWFDSTANSRNAEQMLRSHIATVVGRYAGQVHSWDVVNEAILPSDNHPEGLRTSSPWYRLLGEGYIEMAFRAAAAADPTALLVYSETKLDYDTPEGDARREAVLKLLEKLKSNGTPLHALAIQAHLTGSETRFNPVKLRDFLKKVAGLGLKIMISELDVSDQNLPADSTVRDQIIGGIYEDYLATVLQEPAVISVATWGLSDKYSWLTFYKPRTDALPVRPLPLDDKFVRKPAWYGAARAIANR